MESIDNQGRKVPFCDVSRVNMFASGVRFVCFASPLAR